MCERCFFHNEYDITRHVPTKRGGRKKEKTTTEIVSGVAHHPNRSASMTPQNLILYSSNSHYIDG